MFSIRIKIKGIISKKGHFCHCNCIFPEPCKGLDCKRGPVLVMPVIIRLFKYPQPEQKQSKDKKKSEEKPERRFVRHKKDGDGLENTDPNNSNALEKSSYSSE